MIIANGTIEFITRTNGGLDSNGYPIPATEAYGCPIPCQYNADIKNLLARHDSEPYTRASYSILVEHLGARTERLRLKDIHGNTVKEASVIQFEPLNAVCQTRIYI